MLEDIYIGMHGSVHFVAIFVVRIFGLTESFAFIQFVVRTLNPAYHLYEWRNSEFTSEFDISVYF